MAKLLQKFKKQLDRIAPSRFFRLETAYLYVRAIYWMTSEPDEVLWLFCVFLVYLCYITFPGYLQAKGLEVGSLFS